MSDINDLDILPSNFRHEKEFLNKNNLNNWESILKLNDQQISTLLQKKSLCTKSRLIKIRGIALFIIKLNLTPHQAYLLLHAGIGSLKTLSTFNPHSLKQTLGRLERKMGVRTNLDVNQKLLKEWINKSRDVI
tara:strand:+ start:721 stop:1119 length:399 start_codon:yes stop_codon:yes gene_type:complete